MNEIDNAAWREALQPPPGGLARLIEAVEIGRTRSPLGWPRIAFAATVVVALLTIGIVRQASEHAMQRRIQTAIQTALQAPSDAAVQVENGAALELPSSRPDVRIVWIASLPSPKNESESPSAQRD